MENLDFNVTGYVVANKRSYEKKQVFFSKNRTQNGLTYVLSGELEITFSDGKSFIARENDVILQREGDCYRLEAIGESGAEYVVISYSTEPKHSVLELLGDKRVFSISQRKKIISAFEKVVFEIKENSFLSQTFSKALVQEILCELFREMHPEYLESERPPIESAKFFIDEFYQKNIKISDVAEIAGYSVSRLRAVFKEQYGVSPIHYLTSVRIERAKEMLESRLFTIEEVASACGFMNVYYFSKVFKSATGVSPGRFNR